MRRKLPPMPVPQAYIADHKKITKDLQAALSQGSSVLEPSRTRLKVYNGGVLTEYSWKYTPRTTIDSDLVGNQYLTDRATIVLLYFLLRGPKWVTYNPAKNLKTAFGYGKNTAYKYIKELRSAGHAFYMRVPAGDNPKDGCVYCWKFGHRVAGLPADVLVKKIWSTDVLQYGIHKEKAMATRKVSGKPGEVTLGYPSAKFEGLRPGADFTPRVNWDISWQADVTVLKNKDGSTTEIISRKKNVKKEATKEVPNCFKRAYVKPKTPRPESEETTTEVRIPAKKASKKAESKKAEKACNDNGNDVKTNLDAASFCDNSDVPKMGTLIQGRSPRTVGRRLRPLPITASEKEELTESVLFKNTKSKQTRNSVTYPLEDDPSDELPFLGHLPVNQGAQGRGYRKNIKADQIKDWVRKDQMAPAPVLPQPPVSTWVNPIPNILFYPAGDQPGAPPIVLHHDKHYTLSELARMEPPPDPVLDPCKFPQPEKYDPGTARFMEIPGYGWLVDRELVMIYVTGLVYTLRRIPTAQEICDELDSWNPELQQ